MTETRVWFWIQIGVAIALLAGGAAHYLIVTTYYHYLAELSYFLVYIDAFLFFPGLAVSLVTNALVMRLHGHAGLSRAEKVFLVLEGVFILGLVAFQIWMPFILSPGMFLWLLLVVVAIVLVILAGVRNASIPRDVRQGLTPAVALTPPPVPGETVLPEETAPSSTAP